MTQKTDKKIATMDAQIALPRENGELVFQAPWGSARFRSRRCTQRKRPLRMA